MVPHEQILEISGIHVRASLGVFEHELHEPQPLRIDLEINLGQQPLQRDESQSVDFVDYLAVRQLVDEVVAQGHVVLLETLAGELANRLLSVHGVLGVRVRIQKEAAFLDAAVAVRSKAGRW